MFFCRHGRQGQSKAHSFSSSFAVRPVVDEDDGAKMACLWYVSASVRLPVQHFLHACKLVSWNPDQVHTNQHQLKTITLKISLDITSTCCCPLEGSLATSETPLENTRPMRQIPLPGPLSECSAVDFVAQQERTDVLWAQLFNCTTICGSLPAIH